MAKFELEDKLENYYKAIYNDLEQKTLDDEFGRVYSELPTLNDVFLEITGKELRD